MISAHTVYWIGWVVMMSGGWLIAAAAMGIACFAVGLLGAELFKRLRRAYSLFVIGYWLDRLEREGYHTFERAQQEGRSAKEEQHG